MTQERPNAAEVVRSRAASRRVIPPNFTSSAMHQIVASPSFQSRLADFRSQLQATVPTAALDQVRAQLGRAAGIGPTLAESVVNQIIEHFTAPVRAQILEQQKLIAETLLNQVKVSLAPLATHDFFKTLETWSLPPNLRPIGDQVKPLQVLAFLEEEGIPLYLVPRASVGARLLHAPDHSGRRKILNDCFEQIVDDCEAVVTSTTAPHTKEEAYFTLQGIAALRTGHYAAAQALFTLTLDTLVARLLDSLFNLPKRQHGAITHRSKSASTPPDILDDKGLRDSYVWLPVWNSHGEYWKHKGDAIPRDFSRHATVHAVCRAQYSKRNCVQALMLVTSLVGYTEELYREEAD